MCIHETVLGWNWRLLHHVYQLHCHVWYATSLNCMKTTRNCHTKDNATHNKNILTTKLGEKNARYEGVYCSFVVRPWVSTSHILALGTTGSITLYMTSVLDDTMKFLWVSSGALKLTWRYFVCSRMAMKAAQQSWIHHHHTHHLACNVTIQKIGIWLPLN